MTGILMLQIAVFILSLCLLGSLIGIITLYSKCEELRTEKDKLSKEKDKIKKEKEKSDAFKKDLIAIEPGHKVIYPDYGLRIDTDKDGKVRSESFKVTYELEVLEVTENRIKVKAVDFTSMDQIGRDASKKSGIIQFMKDKWVEKHQVQLIVDDSVKRDLKLRQLGIE
jgi:hypothetical protein